MHTIDLFALFAIGLLCQALAAHKGFNSLAAFGIGIAVSMLWYCYQDHPPASILHADIGPWSDSWWSWYGTTAAGQKVASLCGLKTDSRGGSDAPLPTVTVVDAPAGARADLQSP